MGKLGKKKATKLPNKNTESVEARKRKSTGQNEHPEDEDGEVNQKLHQKKRCQAEDPRDTALDAVFGEDDDDEIVCSDSDEYLSEDSDRASDTSNPKLLSASTLTCLCNLVEQQQSVQALISLLNWYRFACHYGEPPPSGSTKPGIYYDIEDNETGANVIIFVLEKADSTFRGILGISGSSNKEEILKLKNSPKWDSLKPLIKSFLRSTMILVNQEGHVKMLVIALTQLRASIVFFAAFPDLLQKFIKIAVHLWVTGELALQLKAFYILEDISVVFNSECFDTCFISMYKGFLRNDNILKATSDQTMLLHGESFIELCFNDVTKASSKASVSITKLANLLKMALTTENKEAVEKIYSLEYTCCVDLWVNVATAYFHDCDVQPLFYKMIEIINGVAELCPGPCNHFLRVKCIQWLNHLSQQTGVFIPIASLILDLVEYEFTNEDEKQEQEKKFEFNSILKVPKYWLKSQYFQEKCVFTAIDLLSLHLCQWTSNIYFPELVKIPLMRLKKFDEKNSIESLRRLAKQFIYKLETNIEFVQRRREETAALSSNDHQAAIETFLQIEKRNRNAPYAQYYKNMVEEALGIKQVK